MNKLVTIACIFFLMSSSLYGQEMKMYAFNENGKWGFNDPNRKVLISPKYDAVGPLHAPICAVRLNDKWGFIDKNDHQVVPIKYESVNPFYSTLNGKSLFSVCLNNKWGYVDHTGSVLVPMKYDNSLYGFFEGVSMVKLNEKYGFIDVNGNEIIPIKYDGASDFINGKCRVNLNGKTGYVDKTGSEIIPIKFDKIEEFRDGIARVQINGKYGFIDASGKEIISIKYDLIELFRDGASRVEIDGNYYKIDKSEKAITAATAIEHCNCPEPTKEDYFLVAKHSRDQTLAKESSEYTYYFEELMIKMACVDLKNDSREAIIQKVNCMWNKYRTKFSCSSLGFHVSDGNILKYTMNFNFPDFVYYMGDYYDLDFSFEDPADGKTLVEYLDEEISSTKYGEGKKEEMKEIKAFVLKKRKYNSETKMFE